MTSPALRPLALGEILDVSFGIYRSRFAALFLVAVSVQVVPICWRLAMRSEEDLMAKILLTLGYLVVNSVLSSLGVAACTLIVSKTYLGATIGAGDALRRSVPLIGRLVVTSMLTSLVVVVGMILLLVPGLIALAAYVIAPAVVVIESPIGATDAMGRAWRLSAGYRFRTLVAVLIPSFLLLVPGIALGVVAALVTDERGFLLEAFIAMISVFFYPFIYVVISVCYYDLRIRKEGFDLELLAEAVPTG